MRVVDLRSDTVTIPTPSMRKAMAQAAVGDDVFGEDPSVNCLEQQAAALFHKEAALLMPSGTMSNLAAVLGHTHPGDEVILHNDSHVYWFEAGGIARIGGVLPRLLPAADGCFSAEALAAAMRPANVHFAPTRLVCLENTHNRLGGLVLPQDKVLATAECARRLGLKLHLDGARIFNAAAAAGTTAAELAAPFDSVTFCLSKGLAAPVGSVLVGDGEFIACARRYRKMLGGGMRQAGVIAAAGITALDEMAARLTEDHERAARLGEGLAAIPGLTLAQTPQTNMVLLETTTEAGPASELTAFWAEHKILAVAVAEHRIRLVTHYQINDEDIDYVLRTTSEAWAG